MECSLGLQLAKWRSRLSIRTGYFLHISYVVPLPHRAARDSALQRAVTLSFALPLHRCSAVSPLFSSCPLFSHLSLSDHWKARDSPHCSLILSAAPFKVLFLFVLTEMPWGSSVDCWVNAASHFLCAISNKIWILFLYVNKQMQFGVVRSIWSLCT